jgi:hypothetical protein
VVSGDAHHQQHTTKKNAECKENTGWRSARVGCHQQGGGAQEWDVTSRVEGNASEIGINIPPTQTNQAVINPSPTYLYTSLHIRAHPRNPLQTRAPYSGTRTYSANVPSTGIPRIANCFGSAGARKLWAVLVPEGVPLLDAAAWTFSGWT